MVKPLLFKSLLTNSYCAIKGDTSFQINDSSLILASALFQS